MTYRTTRHVGYAGMIREPGAPIEFEDGDDAIRDRLLELGAVVEVGGKSDDRAAAEAKAKEEAGPKSLEGLSFDELKAVAKAEKVPKYGLIRGGPKALREAIMAHRASQAA